MQKLSNIENFFLARFAHSAFHKIHICGAANRPRSICQILFFLFFLSSHHDTNPYLICIIFVKNISIYWLILTVNHQGSHFPIFLSSSGRSKIFVPQQILLPFKAQCLIIKRYLYRTYVLVCQNCILRFSRTREQNWIIICQCCCVYGGRGGGAG